MTCVLLMLLTFSLLGIPTAGAAGEDAKAPTAGEIVARLLEHNAARRQLLHGYTAQRTYAVVNGGRTAQMQVRLRCADNGEKQFDVLSESGSRVIRNLVLHKMVEAEHEASQPSNRGDADITPANYSFELLGTETVGDRPAYLLEINPKEAKKFLIRGRIWVDAADYAIARVEGSPAKQPSFWLHDTRITYVYGKHADLWLPALTRSTSKVRLFGTAAATITTVDYQLTGAAAPGREIR